MKLKMLLPLLFAAALFPACDDSGGDGGGSWTITGTVSDTTNVMVATFSSDFSFWASLGDEDVVEREWDAGTSGEFSPLSAVSPGADGSYSIDLPDDVEAMGDLIAWADTDGDGKFDLGTETAYFPWKTIGGTDYVIGFGYAVMGSDSTYLISYGGSNNTDIDIIGTSAYFFTID